MPASGEQNVVKSAGRVFAILELFDEVERPLNIKEITEALSYPESSTAVLLRSMVALGFLHHDRSARRYMPTLRVTNLGAWVPRTLAVNEQTMKLLHAIHTVTQETILLGVQNDIAVEYVQVLEANRPLRYAMKAGTQRPLTLSGMGWALLSTVPEGKVRALIQQSLAGEGRPESDEEEIIARMQEARDKGYVFAKHTVTKDVGVIAAPLPDVEGVPQMAVGIAGPVARLEEEEKLIAKTLREEMAKLTQ